MGIKIWFVPTKERWNVKETRTGETWHCYDENFFPAFEVIKDALKREGIIGCPYGVASGKTRSGLWEEYKEREGDAEFTDKMDELINWIKQKPMGYSFHRKEPHEELKWYLTGDGDKTRKVCDYCICIGHLKKDRFSVKKGRGHVYTRKEFSPCEYYDGEHCTCPRSEFRKLTKEENEEEAME
jgi:hypothetical protein